VTVATFSDSQKAFHQLGVFGQRLVPAQRKTGEVRILPRAVEREHHHEEQRQVQKEVHQRHPRFAKMFFQDFIISCLCRFIHMQFATKQSLPLLILLAGVVVVQRQRHHDEPDHHHRQRRWRVASCCW
jgi:hypothetical protein